jgi:lipopolysaccharide export system ATP-binding protein
MAILRAYQLVKSYKGRKVVDRVDVEVRSDEIVGLLGPNGAGKTTIFYMMVGITQPEEGLVYLNNQDITYLPMYLRARHGIGYLPQESSVFRKLTVFENIMAVLETLPLTQYAREKRAGELLEDFSIDHLRDTMAFALSGGERRRLEISRALATSPSFILLDEPFAGIDPIAVIDIQSIVSQLRDKGIGILITDHNVRETLQITDRAYIINEGQIIEAGNPYDIANSERARAIYLGENFSLR